MIDLKEYPAISFDDKFLLGAATAGQQIEGHNNSWHDDPRYQPDIHYTGSKWMPAGKACNSYKRWADDLKLVKDLHMNAYRFSIEWSRIEPEEGKFNQEAIEHYLTILKQLKEDHITTVVTLHHVSHPVWFHDLGSFGNMNNLSYFLRYIEKVLPVYVPYVDYWIVLNELNQPFEYNVQERMNMLQYHAHAYHLIKKYTDAPVSSTISYAAKTPYRTKFDTPDRILAEYTDWMELEFFFHAERTGEIIFPGHDAVYCPELKASMDFWAVNIYIRQLINSRKAFFKDDHYTASHFKALASQPFFTEEIHPEIIMEACQRLSDKPILFTENGIACDSDDRRIEYVSAFLQAIHQCMDQGANVIGYLYWSLLDNWEWGSNNPKFGLAYTDENDDRIVKKSGKFYGEICKQHGLNQEIINQFYHK